MEVAGSLSWLPTLLQPSLVCYQLRQQQLIQRPLMLLLLFLRLYTSLLERTNLTQRPIFRPIALFGALGTKRNSYLRSYQRRQEVLSLREGVLDANMQPPPPVLQIGVW